jgi:hypothetical protein
MAVARRKELQDTAGSPAAPRPRPRGVKDGDTYADSHNPIAEQLIRLEGALASDPAQHLPPYSGKVRLAILIGAPAALWALIAFAAMGLRGLF